MPHPADLELAQRVCAADPEAFDAFYERFFRPVSTYARRRIGSAAPARTATEETFVALIDSLLLYDGRQPLAAIVLRIAQQCVDRALDASSRPLARTRPSKAAVRGSL